MNKYLKKTIVLFVSLIVLIALDQITKNIASNSLSDGKEVSVLGNILVFRLLHNSGAVWGSFAGKAVFLRIVSIVFVILILCAYYLCPDTKKNRAMNLCFIFIIAGAFGNMIDRFAYKYVIDFIYFKFINFPIFNVADIYVTCCTILMAILILFYYKDEDFEWMKLKKKS